ncbi:energy transducer TonB [Methylotenera mobilis]|uniref:Protein TonB n=1 Tax=Methylotenera mobilis (strain JLW8 / ATCC BAA-1282 / DSM 17540) TaxID=583345 RepID=C6WZ62_METML|nr:energy transducer TonB [Methylotenera mobilis]ACT49010.1 TonB family protein [Methylotenera mobilis JLW8]
MVSNSELVANPHFFLDPAVRSVEAANKLNVKSAPLKAANATSAEERTVSYRMLALVVALHMTGLVGILYAKPETVEPVKPPEPMMVSLVSHVENMPVEKPLPVVEQKPVVKKAVVKPQKVVEQPRVINDDAARKIEQKEPVTTEKVETPVVAENTPTEAQPAAKATETVAEVAKAKAVPEPAIEPPSFGAAYLNNPAPTYPMSARRMGEQGKVLLKVLVSEDGKATTVQVDRSSGHSKLDEAAVEAVKKWSFVPAKRSNKPMSAYVLVPINFSLNS